MPTDIDDQDSFDTAISPADGDAGNGATFLAAFQRLANRTRYLHNRIGGAPTLAANRILGRASTGPTEGKETSDLSFGLLVIATAVGWFDAISSKGANLASATTTNLSNASGDFVHVTGSATIQSFGGGKAGLKRIIRFAAEATLVHNPAALILPGGVDITTAEDDVAIAVSDGGGVWRVISYQRFAADEVDNRGELAEPYNEDYGEHILDLDAYRNLTITSSVVGDLTVTLLNGNDDDEGSITLIKSGPETRTLTIAADGRFPMGGPIELDQASSESWYWIRYRFVTINDDPYVLLTAELVHAADS